MTSNTCTLCSNALSQQPIIADNNSFCCAGCHAVFNILSTKNQLDNFQNHPIFQQALQAGLISNPALLEEIRRNRIDLPENQLQKIHFEVGEMWCPSCAEVIRLILLQERGVRNCVVDYATDLASVEYSPKHLGRDLIFKKIESLGYKPTLLNSVQSAVSQDLKLRFLIAAFCSLNIMMFTSPIYASYFDFDLAGFGSLFVWLSFFMSLPVLCYSAWPILKRFWTSFKVGLYGMEALVAVGVATAFGLSVYNMLQGETQIYFDSLSVVITFILAGKMIESKAKFSAKDAITRLTHALPRRGRKKLHDGSYAYVSVKEIAPGDLVMAHAGEKIVCDGVVLEGEGLVDEALMTGEMLPVSKKIGASVIGGSIVQNGSIVFRVSEGSALHKIVEMVQQEIGHKSVYVRAVDPIVRWFVPFVLITAFVAGIGSLWFGISDGGKSITETALIRAVSVLLISCPCAIGIAAPLAESQIMNGLAALGAIVRNRSVLTVLGHETAFVFDKTGTITEGHFTVLHGLDALTPSHRAILKGLTSHSNHLIAKAITTAISEPAITLPIVEEIAGKGLRGMHEGQKIHLGSVSFLQSQGITAVPEVSFEAPIHSIVYFAVDGKCISAFVLGDRIRDDVPTMLAELAPAKIMLLSGDANSAVKAVAQHCGIDSWRAECNPIDKRQCIEELRNAGYRVCMVGDGINDAPALTSANVGISVVSATDLSIQVSDILLTTDRLQVLPKMRKLARKGHRIVKQNLFWAFFYNAIGIGLAVTGNLTPIFAAFAMVASSLMVLFNAKRI